MKDRWEIMSEEKFRRGRDRKLSHEAHTEELDRATKEGECLKKREQAGNGIRSRC